MKPAPNPSEPIAGARASSLARNSAAGALADVVVLAGALATAVMTARWLGPAGKGALAALLLIGHGFLFFGLSLGLGDAAIFFIRNRSESPQRVVSASLPVLGISALVGAAVLLAISVPAQWSGITDAVAVTAVGLAAWIYVEFFIGVLNAHERIPLTSAARMVISLSTAVATLILIGIFGLGVLGGTLAVLVAVLLGLMVLIAALRRDGISFRPRWDPGYLRVALRFGAPIQMSLLLLASAQRFDQLVVYSLLGEVQGGRYAVSLTLGWLITSLPGALSRAAFPRLAALDQDGARDLTAQMLRVNMIVTSTIGVGLIVVLPFMVPLLFGDAYRPSVGPALLLLIAGFFWTLQWALTRAAAARGRPGLLVITLLVNFIVMLGLDLLLIPSLHIIGAAVASIAGALAGLLACIAMGAARGLTLRQVVPRVADLAQIRSSLKTEMGVLRRSLAGKRSTGGKANGS